MGKARPSEVAAVKAAVRERDGYCCTECHIPEAAYRAFCGKGLDVHRLAPGSPYTVVGCVTLCGDCHGPKPRSDKGSADTVVLRISKEARNKLLNLSSMMSYTTVFFHEAARFLEDLIDAEYLKVRRLCELNARRRATKRPQHGPDGSTT